MALGAETVRQTAQRVGRTASKAEKAAEAVLEMPILLRDLGILARDALSQVVKAASSAQDTNARVRAVEVSVNSLAARLDSPKEEKEKDG